MPGLHQCVNIGERHRGHDDMVFGIISDNPLSRLHDSFLAILADTERAGLLIQAFGHGLCVVLCNADEPHYRGNHHDSKNSVLYRTGNCGIATQ